MADEDPCNVTSAGDADVIPAAGAGDADVMPAAGAGDADAIPLTEKAKIVLSWLAQRIRFYNWDDKEDRDARRTIIGNIQIVMFDLKNSDFYQVEGFLYEIDDFSDGRVLRGMPFYDYATDAGYTTIVEIYDMLDAGSELMEYIMEEMPEYERDELKEAGIILD